MEKENTKKECAYFFLGLLVESSVRFYIADNVHYVGISGGITKQVQCWKYLLHPQVLLEY